MADFDDLDKVKQFTEDELKEADEKARQSKIPYQLQVSVISEGGVIVTNQRRIKPGLRGSKGNRASAIVGAYIIRAQSDGGSLESKKCLHAAVTRLLN